MKDRSNDSLTVILGAGFSKPAGLPLAKEIDAFFLRDNVRSLLLFSSGEWKWWDYADDVYRNNGRLNNDFLAFGYILNELVNTYTTQNGSFHNYESFYQFIIDNIGKEGFIEELYKRANIAFDLRETFEEKEYYDSYSFIFKHPSRSDIFNLINYLLDDLLYWRRPFNSFESEYSFFISLITGFEKLDIITLNHDFLLEALFQDMGIEYADGFSTEKSPIQAENGSKIKFFSGAFSNNISLLKLHGSIDVYKYISSRQEGATFYPTGEYIYFKTHDYNERHLAKRVNPDTGELLQDFHWNITPQLITGTRKDDIIANDKMFSTLYSEFETRIHENQNLLIIGYSYGDTHVNEKIKSAVNSGVIKKVVNVNPGATFPYETKYLEIVNLLSISELYNSIFQDE